MQNQEDHQFNISFAEKFGIKSEEYINVPISSFSFSVRAINRFMNNGITTVQSLLESTPQSLMALNGFGRNCLEEVLNFCANFKSARVNRKSEKKANPFGDTFRQFSESMAFGDFSFADTLELSDDENKTLFKYKEAFEALGEDLAFECVAAPEKIQPILDMFDEYQEHMQRFSKIRKLIDALPIERKNNRAYSYIHAFTFDDIERNALQSFCNSKNTTIAEMVSLANLEDDANYLLFARFLKWCGFDLYSEIGELFEKLYTNERYRIVIQGRAKKHTLEQIGSELGVTRERIRQIELKAKKIFAQYCSHIRIISKISAERNGDEVLTPLEVEEYCGPNTQECLFLLRTYASTNYTYDQELDIFVLGSDSMHDLVDQYIETLPDIIQTDKLPELIKTACEDENIPAEMLEKAFLNAYRITGNLYHRSRLTLASVYEKTIERHYPNGLKIYDTEELTRFRMLITSEYGDVGLPQNNRALSARIASICILCGRGVYRLKQKTYMPKDLAFRIHEYIVNGDSPIFLTNTLFSVFEEELVQAGITNKYYLQGILHELFSEEFTFRRDYISKDASVTTVYSGIVEFIKRSQYPVSKALIQKEFSGITEIMISFATSDPSILNYFGEYLHVCHLRLSELEKSYLHSVLSNLLNDGQPHHCRDIYEIIDREKPEILKRNAALYQYSAFSILEYLFKDIFQFSRPYIAQNGVDIGRPAERLHDLIYSADEFEVSGISEFAKENRYQIQSILEFINGCNDEFLLINASTMMKIDCIGITKEMAETIDELIANEVQSTMPIYELSAWGRLPEISVPWTEWLLYSVLNKWSRKVSVSTSSNQFRMAIPLVAPVGKMDTSAFANIILKGDRANSIKIDNLDDIDSLLEDIIDNDILEGKHEL